MNEGFHEVPKELQKRGEVLVLVCVDIGKDIILWISLKRGCNIEVMNRGLDTSGMEDNIRQRNRYRGIGVVKGFSMVETCTQAENDLGKHLKYSQIM